MKKRTKVLLLTPDLGIGGAERSFSTLSNYLSQEYDVVSMVFTTTRTPVYPLGGRFASLDVESGSSLPSKIFAAVKRVLRFRKESDRFSADVRISFLEGADYVNLLSGGTARKIISVRGSKMFDGNIRGVRGWIRKNILIPLLYTKADAIVCITAGLKAEIVETLGVSEERCHVVYNGFNITALQAAAAESVSQRFSAWSAKDHLSICSRLTREKHLIAIARVYISLKRLGYKGGLLIVGDGPSRAPLVDLHKSEGLHVHEGTEPSLNDDVVLVGAQANPYKFFKSSSLFLFASESEGGFPNVLGEAMSLGIPVVAADCPWGPREILCDYTCFPFKSVKKPTVGTGGWLMPFLPAEATQEDPVFELWVRHMWELLQRPHELEAQGQLGLSRISDFSQIQNFQRWSNIIDQSVSFR